MIKKILLSLLLIPLIGGIIYAYLYYRKAKTPISDALNAIPANASLIIESKRALNAWEKLSQTNIMWSDLLSTQFFRELNSSGHFIDSLLSTVPDARELLENRSVFISAHLQPAGNFDFLYSYSLPELSREEVIKKLINAASAKKDELTPRKYDDGEIYQIRFLPSKRVFSYTVHKGIFSGSFKEQLVEDAIRQLNNGVSILYDRNFSKVANTAGETTDANIYINYKTFPDILYTFLKPGTKKSMDFLTSLANWSELDVNIAPNTLTMNGYTWSSDSANNYLNILSKQSPQQVELVSVLPASTSTFLYLGISDFNAFNKDYKSYLDKRNLLGPYNEKVNTIRESTGLNIEANFLSWIDNEICVAVTEPSGKDFSDNTFGVFRSNRILEAELILNRAADHLDSLSKEKKESFTVGENSIRRMRLTNLYGTLLGGAFTSVTGSWFTITGDYVVFGNSEEAMKKFVEQISNERKLVNSKYYQEFVKDNLSEEVNLYLYSNIARSTNIYKNYVRDDFEKDIDTYLDLFRKFEAVGIQMTADKGMFYNTLYLRHNPIYKSEPNSLWETSLDTTISTRPIFVVNHTNQTKDVFAQDDAGKVYLISNTGKLLWKKSVEGPILGEVTQIDAFSNDKLQLLFNTSEAVHLLDRNGKELPGFPVRLKSKASAPLAVFDYEGKKEYRILVPTENGELHNFTTKGEKANKWTSPKTADAVSLQIQYIRINGKEYLVAVDRKGKVYIWNRRGEKALMPKEKLPPGISNYFIEPGKDLKNTKLITVDSLGRIRKLVLKDNTESIKLIDFSVCPHFNFSDVDGDGNKDYILCGGQVLYVFDRKKKMILSYTAKSPITSDITVFNFAGNKTALGFSCSGSNEIYLLQPNGKPVQEFPRIGKTAFSIGSMNKESAVYNLVTGSEGRSIYVYPLND
jgi:hypothetical protein